MSEERQNEGHWGNLDRTRDVLMVMLTTVEQMALARGVDLMTAKKIYDAYGADGASRLAEHEALTERVRLLEAQLAAARAFWDDAYGGDVDYDDFEKALANAT